jgi:hypothetical protein
MAQAPPVAPEATRPDASHPPEHPSDHRQQLPRSPAPAQQWSPPLVLPTRPLRRAWRRATATPDAKILTGVATTALVAGVVLAIVFATKAGHHPVGVATASAFALSPAQSESTPAEATAPTVEAPAVEQVLTKYRQAYSAENIEGMRNLFAEDLERHDGDKPPEDLAAALATYERQFGELRNPRYSLSAISVKPGVDEATGTAQYSISSQNGTVRGSITYHLVEQDEQLLIDKLRIEPSP